MKTLADLQEQFQDGDPVSLPPGTPGSVQFLGPINHSVMTHGINVCFRGGQFTTDNDELIHILRGITRRNVGISEVQAVVTESGELRAVIQADQATKDTTVAAVEAVQTRAVETAGKVLAGDAAATATNSSLRPEVAAALAARRTAAPEVK